MSVCFKRSLIMMLLVVMTIAFIPGMGLAEKAYADDPEVISIEFEPGEDFVLYENTGGEWESRYYEDGDVYKEETFFSYDSYQNLMYHFGNKIILNLSDGTQKTYTYRYDIGNGYSSYWNDNGEEFSDYGLSEMQYDDPWLKGKDNFFNLEIGDKSCQVKVDIVDTPLSKLEFIPAKPAVFYENTGGYYDEGKYIYNTDFMYKEGNKIKTTSQDGIVTTYEYKFFEDKEANYYSADGDVLYWNYKDYQYDSPWTLGKDNYVTLECMGKTCKIPVEVAKSPLKSLEFKSLGDISIFENTEGRWDTKYSYSEENGDQYEDYYYYETYRDYVFAEGNKLIVTDLDGNTKEYVYTYDEKTDEMQFMCGNEIMEDVECNDEQYEEHWVVGSSNSFTIEYKGQKISVPVTIIKNDIKELQFETASPIELTENKDGEWKTREVIDENGSYKEEKFFCYEYNLYDVGSKITLVHNDGTEAVYTYDESIENFVGKDGKALWNADYYWYDDQYTQSFTLGVNKAYFVYKGFTTTVDINVIASSKTPDPKTEPGTSAEDGSEGTTSHSDPENNIIDSGSVPSSAPAPTKGADGTALGKGASAEVAAKALTSTKGNKDIKGSVFNKLRVRQSKVTKNTITIKWNKVKNAKKYVIFAGKSGKNNKAKKITTLKSTKTKYTLKKFNKKKLVKGTYYKFAVVALDKNGKVITSSKFAHIATSGKKKASNPAKVTVNSKVKKSKITLKVKKTFKLKGKYASSAKKFKIKKILGMRYESSNPKVATVSTKGVIKAKKKGTCYIYAYAQNGKYKRIKVTVKK